MGQKYIFWRREKLILCSKEETERIILSLKSGGPSLEYIDLMTRLGG